MKKQVLVVEDENDCAELLRYHLQKNDFDAVIAHNGKEAIEAVQRRTPDVVLLDIMMPELNGWEVCRILRESVKGEFLPIIMLSALSDEEERVKGLSLGADDYLTKPYSMKELLLKIQQHIDRRQTLKQLKTREQEQSMTLGYMVHELKNSLNVIGGFSSLALRKDDSNKYLKTIHTASTHAESLLNEASLLSRLEAGGEWLSRRHIDVGQLVGEAMDFFLDAANKKNIEIIFANSATTLVRGDETAIRQILVNLLSNAVKYNREGGKVWIHMDEGRGEVHISITDEGGGIEDVDLGRIFEKFYRAADRQSQKGAGLGLYIVKQLTEAMGGKVMSASQLGTGSTFTVSFVKVESAKLHSI